MVTAGCGLSESTSDVVWETKLGLACVCMCTYVYKRTYVCVFICVFCHHTAVQSQDSIPQFYAKLKLGLAAQALFSSSHTKSTQIIWLAAAD